MELQPSVKRKQNSLRNMNLYQRWKRDKYYMLSGLPGQEGKFKKQFPGFGNYKLTHKKFLFLCVCVCACLCGLVSSLLFLLEIFFKKERKLYCKPSHTATGKYTEH